MLDIVVVIIFVFMFVFIISNTKHPLTLVPVTSYFRIKTNYHNVTLPSVRVPVPATKLLGFKTILSLKPSTR